MEDLGIAIARRRIARIRVQAEAFDPKPKGHETKKKKGKAAETGSREVLEIIREKSYFD